MVSSFLLLSANRNHSVRFEEHNIELEQSNLVEGPQGGQRVEGRRAGGRPEGATAAAGRQGPGDAGGEGVSLPPTHFSLFFWSLYRGPKA